MADNQPAPQPTDGPAPQPSPEEQAYWKTFESRLDAWFEGKVAKYSKTGTSRNPGQPGFDLPAVIAKFVFGSDKK